MTRHLRLAAFASATALTALAGTAASAQETDDDAPVTGDIVITEGLELTGELDGDRFDVWANVLGLKPHGTEETLQVYCIDIRTDLDGESPYAEGDWDASGVANLEQVRWVLSNGHPNVGAEALLDRSGAAPAPDWDTMDTARVAYAGTQAAVWHFTDGFALDPDAPVIDGTDEQNEAVAAVYAHLTENTGRLPDPSEYHITLDGIDEASYENGRFGPYTIRSNSGTVTLAAEGGRLVDEAGDDVDALDDGEDFHIVLDEDSTGITITGHAAFDLPVGRVFLATTEESITEGVTEYAKSAPSQQLILAQPREAEIPAEWTFALELPETERPAEPKPQLPVTGAGLSVFFAAGLVLLIGGLTAIALTRRRSAAE
ncbi:thioester domain-containing protein [Glycomyces halotolerans]